MKEAMKAKSQARLDAIRFLQAALKQVSGGGEGGWGGVGEGSEAGVGGGGGREGRAGRERVGERCR